MPLQKGFLKSQFKINDIPRLRFWAGIIVGLLTAIFFYYLCVGLREYIRYFACVSENFLWQWKSSDVLFYNIIYALFASIFGQTICLEIWFSGNQKTFWIKNRGRRHQVIVDQKLFSWYFSWFLFKIGFMYGILAFSLLLVTVIDLKESFDYLFWLILVNYFFFSWLTIRRKFKSSWKMMLVFLLSICFISLGLVKTELINPEKINEGLIKSNPHFGCQINIPSGEAFTRLEKREWIYNIYLGSSKRDTLVLILEYDISSFSEVSSFIASELIQREPRIRPYIKPALLIDSSMKMKYVRLLEDELIKSNVRSVAYMISNYKYRHPALFSNQGIIYKLPPYEAVFRTNSKRNISQLTPSVFDFNIDSFDFFIIKLDSLNGFIYNSHKSTFQNLVIQHTAFVVTHENRGITVIDIHENSSYYKYIQLLDMLNGTYMKLRVNAVDLAYPLDKSDRKAVRILFNGRYPKQIIDARYFEYLMSIQDSFKAKH